jgi:hypothetical protein
VTVMPAAPTENAPGVYTRQQILDHIVAWRENWLAHRDARTNCVLTRSQIWQELDRWLDALNDLKGR